jgi:Flp pilus assembly protein TadD
MFEENELRSRPRIDQAQRALVDGRLREAVAHAREALRVDPEGTFAYRVLGVVGCRIGDPALVREASLQLPASARELLHSICGSYGH